MSDKFNLKDYKKINGDEHIEKRLRDEHQTEPNAIEEKQLEGYRAEEPETIIEQQLEKLRNDKVSGSTEWRLENSTSTLVKHRNTDAHTGDMNKLEEQRLLSKNRQEDEKPEPASETPKAMRWWEKKSPDGLKLANKQLTKSAEWDFEKDRWGRIEDPEADYDTDTDISGEVREFRTENPFEGEAGTGAAPGVQLAKEPKIFLEPIPGVYLQFSFDERFVGDVYAIEKAVELSVDEMFPELIGFVNTENINVAN